MADIYRFLDEHGIDYERYDHPAVYTVADVQRLVPPLPAAGTKNLFLRNKKGTRHFLVMVPALKRVDLKALSGVMDCGHLSFGSPKRLKKHLGVDPGSVTVLALINDGRHAVEVVFDRGLWQEAAFQFHPLVNTSTLLISRDNLQRFLAATGHDVRVLPVPQKDDGAKK